MKKVFLFMFVFVMSLTLPLANATIEVVKTNGGISISGPSKLRKHISCQMGHSHAYTSQCQTDPPTGHSERTNIPSKVTLTVSGTVSGYGAAGGAFRSAVIDGEKVADWEGALGEQSETLDTIGVCGFSGTSPEAYTEDELITYSVSGNSADKLGTDHQWIATAGIYIRGIEWIGTASSSVSVGVLANLDETPSLSVSATTSSGMTMKYQQAKDKGWSSTDDDGTWEVVPLYRCSTCGGNSESSSDWLRLSGAHSHHFVCGGCGKHIKCKNNHGDHIEVSCPQLNGLYCSYMSYYKCSPHTHNYSSGSSTDNTPNCPDCTTHCSSPCLCTNSGTCNGSTSYHACGQHETSVSGDHSNGTYTCGIHSGYKCQESHDHKTYISSCTSTDSNGNSCTNTGGYYECQPHTHSYPTLVECAHDNCTEMVSSRTSHRTQCGSGQHYYWPGCPNNTNSWSQDSTHQEKTCRYSDCGQTWRRCLTPRPDCTSPNRQRQKCWAQ